MTLSEAINYCESYATQLFDMCVSHGLAEDEEAGTDFLQRACSYMRFAEWLKELMWYRSQELLIKEEVLDTYESIFHLDDDLYNDYKKILNEVYVDLQTLQPVRYMAKKDGKQ